MEHWTATKSGKKYVKAINCHPAFLAYMQQYTEKNARLDEAQAGEIPGEISTISYMQMMPPLWQKAKRN